MTNLPLNTQEFRNALGSFATGVTIVTTATDPYMPVGVTASSFNSVSLDPPLVLWSLAKSSQSLDAFRDSGHFAVHILSCLQEDLSNAFARSGTDKFANVDWQTGTIGSPVLNNFAARFECRTVHQYEGGDHIIFVGEVIAFDRCDQSPLVFHGGSYAETRSRISADHGPTVEPDEARFTEDFFLYLLSRAHFQTSEITRTKTAEFGINQTEYLVIAVLGMNAPLSTDELIARLTHTGHAPDYAAIEKMKNAALLEGENDALTLSGKAREIFISTLSVAKAFEDDLLDHFTPGEIADTKRILKKIIKLTGDNIPSLWA
ncbi:flavin reductase family protein [Parasphingorhabdus sp. JC815]|uniref:flavin reductase family protein n=1 Tax=Parasphingorhabdus sp. JC815 TaxID=3232140 RepID=UPI0034585293